MASPSPEEVRRTGEMLLTQLKGQGENSPTPGILIVGLQTCITYDVKPPLWVMKGVEAMLLDRLSNRDRLRLENDREDLLVYISKNASKGGRSLRGEDIYNRTQDRLSEQWNIKKKYDAIIKAFRRFSKRVEEDSALTFVPTLFDPEGAERWEGFNDEDDLAAAKSELKRLSEIVEHLERERAAEKD